jgi:hypothetical protein
MKLKAIGCVAVLMSAAVGETYCVELPSSWTETERQKIRYEYSASAMAYADTGETEVDFTVESAQQEPLTVQRKSPLKAFLLSMAVPGLGQYYYGSRIKPFLFFGAEVAVWALHIKWHGEGDDLTDAYEAFNRIHWSRDSYENKYLLWAYDVTDDDSVPNAPGITHHLPDEETQQYFEMTGKYNQFAWGWDDAVLDGRVLDDVAPPNEPPPRIVSDSTTPYSARRLEYETMRDDANDKYNDANRMIIVSIVNRLISGFEAYLMTRSHNSKIAERDREFVRLKVRAKLRSFNDKRDTPFVQFTYKF